METLSSGSKINGCDTLARPGRGSSRHGHLPEPHLHSVIFRRHPHRLCRQRQRSQTHRRRMDVVERLLQILPRKVRSSRRIAIGLFADFEAAIQRQRPPSGRHRRELRSSHPSICVPSIERSSCATTRTASLPAVDDLYLHIHRRTRHYRAARCNSCLHSQPQCLHQRIVELHLLHPQLMKHVVLLPRRQILCRLNSARSALVSSASPSFSSGAIFSGASGRILRLSFSYYFRYLL